MAFDPQPYLHLVDDLLMPTERKIEMMEQVSLILQSFVDRAFGLAPEQNLLGKSQNSITACGRDAIGSGLILTPTFTDAANGETARKRLP